MQKWFEALCEVIGAPELASDARFADDAARRMNGDALVAEIERRLAQRPATEWERLLVQRGVPAGAVRAVPDIADSPHIAARGLLNDVRLPGGESVRIVGAGFAFEHDGPRVGGPVPALGEFTDALLARVGYSPAEIAALRAGGAV